MADDAQKVEKQIRAYTAFFNESLKKAGATNAVGAPLVINNLFDDLADGVMLFAIIEAVTGKKAPKFNRKPRLQIQRLENCNSAISFAKASGLKAFGISGDDVEGKNQKSVLAFLWEMINVHGGQETKEFRKPWQWADDIEKKKRQEEEERAAVEEAKRQKEENERQKKLQWQDAAVKRAQDESRARTERKRQLLEEDEQRKIEAERKRGGRICFVAGDNDDPVMAAAVENMIKAGAHVLAVIPNRNGPLAEKLGRLGAGVQIVEANPNDPKALDKAFSRGVYKVIYSPKENAGMVEQAKAVAKAAKKAGVQHIVKVGMAGSESRNTDLAIWHEEAEKAMEAEAVPLTKVKVAPMMNSIAKTMEDGVARLPTGAGIAWVDPSDAGLACAKAILSDNTKGKAFTITGPEKLSGDGVVSAVGDALEEADDDDDIRRKKVKRRTKTGAGAAAADADDAVGGGSTGDAAAGRQGDKVKQTESDLLAALWKKQRLHGCEAVAPDEMQAFLTQHFGLTPAQAKAEVDKFQALAAEPTNDFEELTGQRAKTLKEFATENKAAFDKPAKIFVVGADDSEGKGLAIVQNLRSAEKNVPVKAAVKSINSPEAQALRKLGCEVVEVDTLKLASVGKAMTGCDKVVLVQDARPSLPQETKTVLTAAKKIPTVGHVVATSVLDADKRDDVIAQWHADAEQMLQESGVPFTVVRTAPTFADFVSATGKSIREQGVVESCLPEGSKAAWLHPSDLANAVAKITETAAPGKHKNQTYNLTGPEELTPQQLCDHIAKAAGLQHKLVHKEIPPDQVQAALEEQGLDGDVAMGKAKRLANVKSKPVSGDYEALTGLKPMPLEKYAEDHPEQFQAPERVVVLGADSPVGAEAVQKLARSGGPAGGSPVVVAVVKSLASPEAHVLKSIPHVQVVQADTAKAASLQPVVQGAARVVLVQPDDIPVSQIPKQAEIVAKVAKEAGVGRVVRVGQVGSEARATALQRAHDDAEKAIEKAGVPAVFVRSCPRMDTISAAAGYYPPEGSPTPSEPAIPGSQRRFPGASNARRAPPSGQDGRQLPGVDEPESSPNPGDLSRPGSGKPRRPGDLPESSPPGNEPAKPGSHFPSQPQHRKVAVAPDGTVPLCLPFTPGQSTNVIDPKDLGSALAAATMKPDAEGTKFNVVGPQVLTGTDIADKLAAASGLPIKFSPNTPTTVPVGQAGDYPQLAPSDDFTVLTGDKPNTLDKFLTGQTLPSNLTKQSPVFVSNATCPMGLAIAKRLASTGQPVFAAVKSLESPEAETLRSIAGIEPVLMDVENPAQLKKLPELMKAAGIKKVCVVDDDHPQLAHVTKAIAQAAKDSGAAQLIKIGCVDSAKRRHPKAVWHDDAEQAIKEVGVPCTVIRHGPTFQDLLGPSKESLKDKLEPTLAAPSANAIAWISPEDVAEAVTASFTRPPQDQVGKVYNVTGSEPLKASQIAKLLAEESERPITAGDVNRPGSRPPGNLSPKEQAILDAQEAYLKDLPNDASAFPTNDFEALTGHKPQSMRDFIKENAKELANPKRPMVLNADDADGVGFETVRQLAKSGKPVIAAVSSLKGMKADDLRKLGANVELRLVDATKPEELAAALKDVDQLIDIAENSPTTGDVGKALSSTAKAAGVEKIVRVCPDHGDARNTPLAVAHSDAERALVDSGVPTVLIHTGPMMSTIARDSADSLKKEGKLSLPTGSALAVIDPRDVGEAAARAAEIPNNAGQVYNVSGSEPLTGEQLAQILSDTLGSPIEFENVPVKEMKKRFGRSGVADPASKIEEYLGWAQRSEPSSDFAALTGHPPRPATQFAESHPNAFAPQHALLVGGDSPQAVESAKRLDAEGIQVTALVANPSSPEAEALRQLPNVTVVPFSAAAVQKEMERTDQVLLCGADSPSLPLMADEVAKAIKKHPPKQVVKVGKIGSEQRAPTDEVSTWHVKAEKSLEDACKVTSTPYTFLQGAPSMEDAARQCKAMNAINPNAIGLSSAGAKVAFLDSRDMGRAVAAAMTGQIPPAGEGRVMNITGPAAIGPEDLAKILSLPENSPDPGEPARPGHHPSKPGHELPEGSPTSGDPNRPGSQQPRKPAPTVKALSPSPDCTLVNPTDGMTVEFNEPVKLAPGAVLKVHAVGDPSHVIEIPLERAARVSPDGKKVEIVAPQDVLQPGKSYSASLDPGSVVHVSAGREEESSPTPGEPGRPGSDKPTTGGKASAFAGIPPGTWTFSCGLPSESSQPEDTTPGKAPPRFRPGRPGQSTPAGGPVVKSISPSPGCATTALGLGEPLVVQFNEPVQLNPGKGNLHVTDGVSTIDIPLSSAHAEISPDGKEVRIRVPWDLPESSPPPNTPAEPGSRFPFTPGRTYSVALDEGVITSQAQPDKPFSGICPGQWTFSVSTPVPTTPGSIPPATPGGVPPSPALQSLSPTPGFASGNPDEPVSITFAEPVKRLPGSGKIKVIEMVPLEEGAPSPSEPGRPGGNPSPIRGFKPGRTVAELPIMDNAHISLSPDGRTLTYTPPPGTLAPGAKYSVAIDSEALAAVSAGIITPAGSGAPPAEPVLRKFAGIAPGEWVFHSGPVPRSASAEPSTPGNVPFGSVLGASEPDAPSVRALCPSPGMAELPGEPLTIQFNEPVKLVPTKGKLRVWDGNKDIPVDLTSSAVSLSPDGKTLTIHPNLLDLPEGPLSPSNVREPGSRPPLVPGKSYGVTVDPESIVRADTGKPFQGICPGEWFFSVSNNPEKKSFAAMPPSEEQLVAWAKKEFPPETAVAIAKHQMGWASGLAPTSDFESITGTKPNPVSAFVSDKAEEFVSPPVEAVAVIGADTVAGVAAVKELARSGKKVKAGVIDQTSVAAQELKAIPDVEVMPVTPVEPQSLAPLLQGCNKAVWNPLDTANLVAEAGAIRKACEANHVAHLVKVGCMDSPQREHPVAVWHDDAEKVLAGGPVAVTNVRATLPMTNISEVNGAPVEETGSVQLPMGESAVAFIDPRDVGFAAAKAISDDDTKNLTYNLTGPEALTGDQVADILSEQLHRPVTYDDVQDSLAVDKLKEATLPDDVAAAQIKKFTAPRNNHDTKGHSSQSCPTKDFYRLTGMEPRSLATFTADLPQVFTEPQENPLTAGNPKEPGSRPPKKQKPKAEELPKDEAVSRKREFLPPVQDTDIRKDPDLGNVIDSEWDEFHCGGNHDFATWRLNPQFKIKVDRPMTVDVTLTQKGAGEPQFFIGAHIVKNNDPSYVVEVSPSHNVLVQTRNEKLKGQSHEKARSVHLTAKLEDPSATYFLVPSTFYQERITKFEIDVANKDHDYHTDPVNDGITIQRVKEPRQYNYTLDIRGDWTGPENCPGGRDSPFWRRNPQFKFCIGANTPKRTPAHVTVIISRAEQSIDATEGQEGAGDDEQEFKIDMVRDKLLGISLGVHLVRNRSIYFSDFVLPNHDVCASIGTEYSHTQSSEVACHCTIPVEDFGETFFVVPSTGEPGAKLAFICTVHSDTPLSLRRVDTDEGEGACVEGLNVNVPPPLRATVLEGAWTKESAGGAYNASKPELYRSNPTYRLVTASPTPQPVSILLTQLGVQTAQLAPMAIHCIRNSALGLTHGVYPNFKVVANSMANEKATYAPEHQVSVEVLLNKDEPLIVVPSLYEAGRTGQYRLTLLSADATATLQPPDPSREVRTKFAGAWKRGNTAGGRRRFASWIKNPQYRVVAPAGTSVQAVLRQKRPKAASVHICRNADDVVDKPVLLPGHDVIAELRENGSNETYFTRAELALGYVVEDSQPLFVVPSLFQPDDDNDFEFEFISDRPITVEPVDAGALPALPVQKGEWKKGYTDGGNATLGSWRRNPQFRLRFRKAAPVMVTLIRTAGDAPIGVTVVRNKPGDANKTPFLDLCVLADCEEVAFYEKLQGGKRFRSAADGSVSLRLDAQPNVAYFVVPSCNVPGEVGAFELKLEPMGDLSPADVEFEPVRVIPQTIKDRLPKGIKGNGGVITANPAYQVVVRRRTHLCCTFRRDDSVGEYAFSLALLQNPAGREGAPNAEKGYKILGQIKEIVDGEETELTAEPEACFYAVVEPGTYHLVPTLTSVDEDSEVDDYGEFVVSLYADAPDVTLGKFK